MVQAMPGLTHPASRAISSCLKIKQKKIEEALLGLWGLNDLPRRMTVVNR